MAGIRPLPKGDWCLVVGYRLFTLQMDIDGPSKAILDVVSKELEVDDACVVATYHAKTRPQSRADERVEVVIAAYPIVGDGERNDYADAYWRLFGCI